MPQSRGEYHAYQTTHSQCLSLPNPSGHNPLYVSRVLIWMKAENMSNLIGQSLGRYHILEQLGQGGMAIVYKAYDTRLERDVAIKIIRKGVFPPDHVERILKRFEREAKALARLSHSNIVKVYDYGEHEGAPYLVMEYLPSGTLKQKLGRPILWHEAIQILLPIAEALDYAHSQNMIHRDVKPSNILLTQRGQPMLTDFGIAKILDLEETQDLTGTSAAVGTPEYMAPEQATAKNIDHRADIYALGIVLYEMVTGRKPYTADTPLAVLFKHASEPLPRPKQFVPDLPDGVERILLKALAKNPADRYQSMAEIGVAFEKILDGQAKKTAGHERLQTDTEGESSQVELLGNLRHRLSSLGPYSRYILFGLVATGVLAAVFYYLPQNIPVLTSTATDHLTPNSQPNLTSTGVFPSEEVATPALLPTHVPTQMPLLTPTPGVGSTMTSEKDGMGMVFVPAGEFIMGASPDLQGEMLALCQSCNRDSIRDQAPQRSVYLDAFWIDQTEVTIAQFQKFVQEENHITAAERKGSSLLFVRSTKSYQTTAGVNWRKPGGTPIDLGQYGNYPVTHVSWDDAQAYCSWMGGRLPTEAEWEKAARGTDGRFFPWGNAIPDNAYLNFNLINNGPVAVMSYSAGVSPSGSYDMAGNVWEWVNDWYAENYDQSETKNPQGPMSGSAHIFRGGSWASELSIELVNVMTTFRYYNQANFTSPIIGFRCVKDANP